MKNNPCGTRRLAIISCEVPHGSHELAFVLCLSRVGRLSEESAPERKVEEYDPAAHEDQPGETLEQTGEDVDEQEEEADGYSGTEADLWEGDNPLEDDEIFGDDIGLDEPYYPTSEDEETEQEEGT